MFRQLLRDGQLREKEEPKFGTAVERAHKSDFITSSCSIPPNQAVCHKHLSMRCDPVSLLLIPPDVDLPSELSELVWEVLGLFKHSQLPLLIRLPGPAGTSESDQPPDHETQHPDEFY
jgi:hypothetical protein